MPLNIYEPRYLQMVTDALKGSRLIGMIQPLDPDSDAHEPAVQSVGCAGRIASFKESAGRYTISLVGISRFEVVREYATDKLYRIVEPSWKRFGRDRRRNPLTTTIDREELVAHLRIYFDARGMEANWHAIEGSGNEELVNSLAMVCPFDSSEKQALLEAPNLEQRSRLVIALMNMAVLHRSDSLTVH